MTLMDDLVNQAKNLSTTEQLKLIELLVKQARFSQEPTKLQRHWKELKGTSTFPLAGEDAQVWVSRQRQSSDASRQQSLRGDA